MKARYLGTLHGRRVHVYPVRVALNDSYRCRTLCEVTYEVTSHTPQDAANYIADLYRGRPETEVFAYGPQGGETYRYVGWTSAIWHALPSTYPYTQPRLPLEVAL